MLISVTLYRDQEFIPSMIQSVENTEGLTRTLLVTGTCGTLLRLECDNGLVERLGSLGDPAHAASALS
jgi:hypothetical protein